MCMRPLAALTLALLSGTAASSQEVFITPHKRPDRTPKCAAGAICFAGEVTNGREFRHSINSSLEFVLEPGWNIIGIPKKSDGDCKEFASVVNRPYRAHRQLEIDTSYGWTAQDEVNASPRTFYFVMNCADYRIESKRLGIVLWGDGATEQEYQEAVKKLATSPLGTGRFWIIDSKIMNASDRTATESSIQWMKFAVEIKLPDR
jgi:hypothetical protein